VLNRVPLFKPPPAMDDRELGADVDEAAAGGRAPLPPAALGAAEAFPATSEGLLVMRLSISWMVLMQKRTNTPIPYIRPREKTPHHHDQN
jgi:hypothetical protein